MSDTSLMTSELEGKSLSELDEMRQRLIGNRNSMDEMTEEELLRFIAICNALKLTSRPASKPAANGGRKRTAKDPEKSLEESFGGTGLI